MSEWDCEILLRSLSYLFRGLCLENIFEAAVMTDIGTLLGYLSVRN